MLKSSSLELYKSLTSQLVLSPFRESYAIKEKNPVPLMKVKQGRQIYIPHCLSQFLPTAAKEKKRKKTHQQTTKSTVKIRHLTRPFCGISGMFSVQRVFSVTLKNLSRFSSSLLFGGSLKMFFPAGGKYALN